MIRRNKIAEPWGRIAIRRGGMLLASALVCLLASCGGEEQFPEHDAEEAMNEFFREYNERTVVRLVERGIEGLEERLQGMDEDHPRRSEVEEELGLMRLRAENAEMFTFASIEDLPDDLNWETNLDDPEIGSASAVKGGVFNHYFMGLSWPPTLRIWGSDSNNSFRSEHFDNVDILPVHLHPETGNIIPGLAEAWAVGDDGRTVYFRLDPDATYHDGVPVRSEDFFMQFYIQLSGYISNAFTRDYYQREFENITRYDDRHFSIRLTKVKPLAPTWAAVMPAPLHFYREFGPDFEARFQWRPRITTGAYVVGEIVKGRSITLHRVEDWWARDRKYYRHRFNPDRIHYHLVRDSDKAFELFMQHRIDVFHMNAPPKFWYERTEADQIFDGYIEKVRFYNDYPRVPRGLYVNHNRPLLDNQDIRIGLQYATNFQKMIDFDLRGDPRRLNLYNEGFGRFSHPTQRTRPFNVAAAREAFARAGFDSAGPDGILRDSEGRRLSFAITYVRDPFGEQIMQRLKEEAVRAGLEYRLDPREGTSNFQHVMQKRHDIAYWGWGTTPPFPDYFQSFFSEFAFEEDGRTPKPMTNNISTYASAQGDIHALGVRNARTLDDIEYHSHRMEELIHEEAIWIPGFTYDFYRLGHWRWVRFPEDTFNVPISRDALETHVHWVDVEKKEDTLAAMREGRVFPEVDAVYDQFRNRAVGGGATQDGETAADESEEGAVGESDESEPGEEQP